jgi:hypothetical protein
MRSVCFNDEASEPISAARIDEILRKRDRAEFLDLIAVLIAYPLGPTAANLERLFLAAYHLVVALRQCAPHHRADDSPASQARHLFGRSLFWA